MVTREHHDGTHIRKFTVTRGEVGWDVREERDSEVVRRMTYTDWHRVERALRTFDLQESRPGYSTNR